MAHHHPPHPALSAGASDLQRAGEDLVSLLERSGAALATVARRLEEEFADRFAADGVNPLAVARRVRRLERDLPELKARCQEVIAAKQELADAARSLLRGNRETLQALAARSGAPRHDDAAAVAAFDGALNEWDAQLRRAREAGGVVDGVGGCVLGGGGYSAEGLNAALARSNLQ